MRKPRQAENIGNVRGGEREGSEKVWREGACSGKGVAQEKSGLLSQAEIETILVLRLLSPMTRLSPRHCCLLWKIHT